MDASMHVWRTSRRDVLRVAMGAALTRYAASPEQHALLKLGLGEFDRRDAGSEPITIAHQLPLLIHCAIRGGDPLKGDDQEAMPLALTTALMEVGIDLLDHVADRELASAWSGLPTAAATLAATGFIGCLPHLAVAELGLSPERQAALHVEMAQGLARIGAGQQRDFSVVSLADASEALKKTGERYGLYASLAAQFSGARPEHAEAWREMGWHMGAARQLASDCADVLSPGSRDLRSKIRTWPIVWLVERVREREGERAVGRLLQLMEAAGSEDADAHAAIRHLLIDRGAVRRVAWEVEIHCRQAIAALGSAAPPNPARALLEQVIQHTSLLDPTSPAAPAS